MSYTLESVISKYEGFLNNRTLHQSRLDVMRQAEKDISKIQWCNLSQKDKWYNCNNESRLDWNWDEYDFRIKPEPPEFLCVLPRSLGTLIVRLQELVDAGIDKGTLIDGYLGLKK